MNEQPEVYPARLEIDYPDKLDRFSTFFRLFLVLPILLILALLTTASGGAKSDTSETINTMGADTAIDSGLGYFNKEAEATEQINETRTIEEKWTESNKVNANIGIIGGLFMATALMIIFRQRYPRWWFDFMLELTRFSMRVGAYLLLLTDKYPSTVEGQSVRLELDYPDVEKDLNRWLPIFKWLLAIPHYVALLVLFIGVFFATIIAWFAILITGKYPRRLFRYVVGVERWGLRVNAYAFFLLTDKYPPFSLK